jgi:glycosyltransferase involved in cell wall biosynthesis
MRLAFVGNFGFGYKATMAARALPIAHELVAMGHEVTIYVPADGPPPTVASPAATMTTDHADCWTLDGVSVRSFGSSLARPDSRALVDVARHVGIGLRIAVAALADQPDVLYCFKPIGYAGLALASGWLRRQLGRRPLVLALDADDWEGIGGWADRDGSSGLLGRLITAQEEWTIRHADLVTVASRELASRCVSRRVDPLYVPNAASPSSPGWSPGNPAELRRRLGLSDEPIVLAYSRFVEFEPERLLTTFQSVVQAVPAAHLIVAGQGLAGEEKAFARLARERGLGDHVHVLGWIPLADLPDVFAAADLALYLLDDTRLNRAKCPMKLVDLLLAGVPVVADRVGQAGEYVIDGQTGTLVSPGDVAAMVAAAVALLQDREGRQRLGRSARADIFDRWRWSNQASLIAAALQARRPAAR